MDRGVLAMATGPTRLPIETGAELSAGLSDAEVMLRVKAGDESAFDYLVQKYRRPMVSFMYRMSHNAAAAEDLAQEVFLRVYRSRETYEAEREVHYLAVSHRDQPGSESCARYAHDVPRTRPVSMNRTRIRA